MHSRVTLSRDTGKVPVQAGIGLRADHYFEVLETRPAVGFFEVHSENFFGDGGRPHAVLESVRADYPLSFHGVGLSLGSTDPLDRRHVNQLKALVARFEPGLVSDHLSWSSIHGRYLNDLLPLPYTAEALVHVARRVSEVQEVLGRQLLVENISSYLQYEHSTIPEPEFLAELAQRSGCGILLDVNNVYVSSRNHGFDAARYIASIPASAVGEIHLAGHTVNATDDGGEILIDTHNQRVTEDVWALYRYALRQVGPKPTLIEWDTDMPPLAVLLDEARIADLHLEEPHARAA